MAYLIETVEDKIKYELGSRLFEIEILKHELNKALSRVSELEQGTNSETLAIE